jgi:hypothetical protein
MLYGAYKYGRAAYSTADLEEGSVLISGLSAVSADSTRVRESSASIGIASSVTLSGFVTRNAQSATSASSSVSAAGERIHLGQSSASAASSVTFNGQVTRNGSSATSALSGTSITGQILVNAGSLA